MFKEKQSNAGFGNSHTHILNDIVAHVTGIPRRGLNPRPHCLRTSPGGGRGSVVK